MKRSLLRNLLLLGLLLGPAAAQADDAFRSGFGALLPEETLFMVEFNDLGGQRRWERETALGRICAEPEVQRFAGKLVTAVRGGLREHGAGVLGMVGLRPEDLEGIRLKRGGFAVVDAGFETQPILDAVLFLEAREGGEKLEKIVAGIRSAIETFAGLQFAEVEIRGRKVAWVGFFGFTLFLHAGEGRVVVTTLRDRMDQVLAALDGTNERPLRAAPAFVKVRARMGAERTACFGYANVPRIYARVTGAARRFGSAEEMDKVDSAWNRLGLGAVEAVAFGDIVSGTGFRTELAITMKERKGLFALLPDQRPTHRFARYAPANALVYGGERFDLEAFWTGVLGLVESFDPGARSRLEECEGKAGGFLGIDLRKDLLASFGDEWSGYIGAPPGGGLWPDVVVFATVRDRARLEGALDTIVARLEKREGKNRVRVKRSETSFRGTRIRFVELSHRDEPAPIAPAWAFGEDFVVFGLYPQSVKHALLEKRSLQGNEDFRALLRTIPESAVSSTYLDARGLFGWLYNTVTPMLQAAQGAINRELGRYGVQLNFQDLPPAEVITRHLRGAMFYTAVEEDCVRMGVVSPFGAAILAVPVAAAGALGALAYRSEAKARHRMRRAAERAKERALRGEGRAEQGKGKGRGKGRGRGRGEGRAEQGRGRAAERAELEALRRQNRLLRQRLELIEKEVAEIKRLIAERDRK